MKKGGLSMLFFKNSSDGEVWVYCPYEAYESSQSRPQLELLRFKHDGKEQDCDRATLELTSIITNVTFYRGEQELREGDPGYQEFYSLCHADFLWGGAPEDWAFYGFKVQAYQLQLAFRWEKNPRVQGIITVGKSFDDLDYRFRFGGGAVRLVVDDVHRDLAEPCEFRLLMFRIQPERWWLWGKLLPAYIDTHATLALHAHKSDRVVRSQTFQMVGKDYTYAEY